MQADKVTEVKTLTAEETIAVQEESPAATDHDDQADHDHCCHHSQDVDILWKREGVKTELWPVFQKVYKHQIINRKAAF